MTQKATQITYSLTHSQTFVAKILLIAHDGVAVCVSAGAVFDHVLMYALRKCEGKEMKQF